MKRRTLLSTSATLALASAARADTLTIPSHGDVDDVKALLDASAREWSAGDLDAFCAHYADDAVFVSPSGLTRGRAEVLARYKKKYATKAQMGALGFDVLDVVAGATTASVAMKWRLTYAGKPTAEGWSVIGLVKRGRTWLIKHDASM